MATPENQGRERSDWGVLALSVLVGVAILGLLVAAYAIGNTKGSRDAREEAAAAAPSDGAAATSAAGVDESAVLAFTGACGSCHTLAVAGTSGTVGPNLDELMPTVELVLAAIANGGTGTGQMPAGLLAGDEAERVAGLVASTAGGGG
jgi:mono/diheme cytochrome c family protein